MTDHRHVLTALASAAIAAAGGPTKLAAAIGSHKQTVHSWRSVGIPPHRVRAVSQATGIPLHQLRPDLYDAPVHSGHHAIASATKRDTSRGSVAADTHPQAVE